MALQGFSIRYNTTTINLLATQEDYTEIRAKKEFAENKTATGKTMRQKIGIADAQGEIEAFVSFSNADTIYDWYLNDYICVFTDCYGKTFNVWLKSCNFGKDINQKYKKVFLEMVVV